MIFIPPEAITVPENRFRRDFDERKLNELRDSILRIGLIQLPTVEKSPEDGRYVLRSGERRLRVLSGLVAEGKQFSACSTPIPGGMVPVAEWNELSSLQRLEVEVEENVVRADFTWQERANAIKALHDLRKGQNPTQAISATASEILGKPAVGSQSMAVSDALIVAKHLANPEVAKAKTQKDALKIIRHLEEAKHRELIAKTYDISKIPHKLLKGEARDILLGIPDHSFDVIITDPPYGVGADGFGSMASTGHDYEDSYKYWKDLMVWFSEESARVSKPRSHAYVFCDTRRFDELCSFMVLANWRVFPWPLIWDKQGGMLPFPEYGPRRSYEAILYAWRGDRRVLLTGKSDIIRAPQVRELLHGAQKPVAVYENLLSRSARPGDAILDCFGGTGPALVAANRMNLICTYIERNEEACNIALGRASQTQLDDGVEEIDGLENLKIS